MNLEIKTLYVLLYLLIQVSENNGSVNVRANNDNPLLLKILQSLDVATSDRKLFEVTLKLIDSVCVCMQQVLRKRQKYMFLIENNSLHTDDEDDRGNKTNLYKKIYNKTCINLRQELEENVKKQHNDSDVTHRKQFDRDTAQKHTKKYFTLLFQSLISTQDYHTYNIHRHNLYRNKLAFDNNQESSVIIIVTLYPDNEKFGFKKTKTLNEYLINETLHSHTAIDIDIINKSSLQKNDEILKLDKVEKCHLYSIYLFLIESQKENLIHLYKLLSVKGTVKMYIDVLPDQHHADFYSKCCHNDSALITCQKQILSGQIDEHSVTSKSEQEDVVSYRDIISNIKVLVEEFKKKVNINDTATTDNIDDLNYTKNCDIECIYTTEKSEVSFNNNTRKHFEPMNQIPIKQPIIEAHPIHATTTKSLLPSTNILLEIKTNNSKEQIDSILKSDKNYSKAVSKSTETPFDVVNMSKVTKKYESFISTPIIIAKIDKINTTNSPIKLVDSLNNSTNLIDTSNISLLSKHQFAIKKPISRFSLMINKTTSSVLPTSANDWALINNDYMQRNNTVIESEKIYANIVNKSQTTTHSVKLIHVTKKYENLFYKTIAQFKHSTPDTKTLFKNTTSVIDLFESKMQKDRVVNIIPNIEIKGNKNTFTVATNKNKYTHQLFDDEIVTLYPVDVTREFIERNNSYHGNNTNSRKSNYAHEMNSNSSKFDLYSNKNLDTVKPTTQHNSEKTSYLSNNKSSESVKAQLIMTHNDPKTQVTLKLTSKSPDQLKSKNDFQKIFTEPTVVSKVDRNVITKEYKNNVHTERYDEKTKQLNVMNMNSNNKEKIDNYMRYTDIYENMSSRKMKSHLEKNNINNSHSVQDRAERSSLIHTTKNKKIVNDLFEPLNFTQPYNEIYHVITQDNFSKVDQSPHKKRSTIHLKHINVYQDKLASTRTSLKINLPINKNTNECKNITQLCTTNNTAIETLETIEKEKKSTIVFAYKENTMVTTADSTKNMNTEAKGNTVPYLELLTKPSEIFNYNLLTFGTVLLLTKNIIKKENVKSNLQNLTTINNPLEYTLRNINNTEIKKNPKGSPLHKSTVVLTDISYSDVETPKVLGNCERRNEKLSKESAENRSKSFKNTYYLMTTELVQKKSNETDKPSNDPHTHNNEKKVTSPLQTTPYVIGSSENAFEKSSVTKSAINFYNEIKEEKYLYTTTSLSQNESNKFSTKFLETRKTPSITQVNKPNYLNTTIPSNIIKNKNNSNSRNNFTPTYKKEIKRLRTYDATTSNNKSMRGSNRRVNNKTATKEVNTNVVLLDEDLNNLLPAEDYITPVIISKNKILSNEITKLSSGLNTDYETFTLSPVVINKPGNFEINERLQAFNNSQNQNENEFTSTMQILSNKNADTTQRNHEAYKTRVLGNKSEIKGNKEKNVSATNLNQASLTTESLFVILETTINNPRIHTRIENVTKTNFTKIYLNNTTNFPPDNRKKESKIRDTNSLMLLKQNGLSSLKFHIDKYSTKPQNGKESIIIINKSNDTNYGTRSSTVSSYTSRLKFEGIHSQINAPTSATIYPGNLHTSTIEHLPALKTNSFILNHNESKEIFIPRKTTPSSIPLAHTNIHEIKLTNCSYLEVIQNVQKDKSEQIIISPTKMYKVKDSSAISNGTSTTFFDNVKNANASLSTSGILWISDLNQNSYLTAFNNVSKVIQSGKRSSEKLSQFVVTETTPNFKNLNSNNRRRNLHIKSAIIHEKNSNDNITTPRSVYSNNIQPNKISRNHVKINNIEKYDKDSSVEYSPVTSKQVSVPMRSEIDRNFKNATHMLNTPVLKSVTEFNEYSNKDEDNSHCITTHSHTVKLPSNKTIHHSLHPTSSNPRAIYSLSYPITIIQPKINKNYLMLTKFIESTSEKKMESKIKQIDNIDDKSPLNETKSGNSEIGKYRIQGRNNFKQEMPVKHKYKLVNIPSTYTDTYYPNISINKNQVKETTTKMTQSSTLTNISIKDDYNLNKNNASNIKYDIIQNKNKINSFITLKDKLYQNKSAAVKNVETTLNDVNFLNLQEKTQSIFINTNKLYAGVTTKRPSLNTITSDNIDIKNFTHKLNSKSTRYFKETYPFQTSRIKYTTPLKQSANDKESTKNIPLSYTKMGAPAITAKVDTLNDTDMIKAIYKFSNKSDLYSEAENPFLTVYFENNKQLETSVKENTSKIPLTFTTIHGNRNKIKNQENDTIKIKKSLISINNTIKNVSSINISSTKKTTKLYYGIDTNNNNNFEKLNSSTISKNNFHVLRSTESITLNSYQDTKNTELNKAPLKSNIVPTNNKNLFPMSQVTKDLPITLKIKNNLNFSTTLHKVKSQTFNHHEMTDKIILHNSDKIYDRRMKTKIPASFTTKRKTFISFTPVEANVSHNADIENFKHKLNYKSRVKSEDQYSLSTSSLLYITPLKQNTSDKRNTMKRTKIRTTHKKKQSANDKRNSANILLPHTTMRASSKAFKANMLNDTDNKDKVHNNVVYSKEGSTYRTSTKNNKQLTQSANDEGHLTGNSLAYTKSNTSVETLQAHISNDIDIKNSTYNFSNKSAGYSKDARPLISSAFKNTKLREPNIIVKGNRTKIPITYTTILVNMNKNKNRAKKLDIKKSFTLTNIKVKDKHNISNNTTKALPSDYNIVKNKSNAVYYNSERHESNRTKTNKPSSYITYIRLEAFTTNSLNDTDIKNAIHQFGNKSSVYSTTHPLPTSSFSHTKQLKESANSKENTAPIPFKYTSTKFKAIKANISNKMGIKTLKFDYSNKNTIHLEETAIQRKAFIHIIPSIRIIINEKNKTNTKLSKFLLSKPIREKINKNNIHNITMVTKIEQKTSRFNYNNNYYNNKINRKHISRERLRISDIFETLQTHIYRISTEKTRKKAKTIKYNTYKPTEEDPDFKIRPFTIVLTKLSPRIHRTTPPHTHHTQTTKSIKYTSTMKTNKMKIKTTRSPHTIIRQTETKNARKTNSLERNLLDPFGKANRYHIVKTLNKRRKVIKRLRLTNKGKGIPTIVTNDFFSLRKNAHLLQKSPQRFLGDFLQRPVIAPPKEYVVHPKFKQIDAAMKSKEEHIRPKPLFLAYNTNFYREDYQTHHRSRALSLREKVNHIRDTLPVPPAVENEQPVIQRPTYLPLNTKPKLLRDRIYSIRNYIHNKDLVKSTQFPSKNYLVETTTDSLFKDPFYYFRRSGWYEEQASTKEPITVKPTRRKRRTIYFLSPTVPYYRYF